MKVHVRKTLIVALCCIGAGTFAKADLARQIDSIINRPSQKTVQFSIHIVDADSGKAVYEHAATEAFVPASNMKIVVTAAALKYLGPKYEFKTKVGLCGDTLVIIGSGDPLLGDEKTDIKYGRDKGWIFEDIATVLKRRRVVAVKDILVDSSIFDDQRVHANWPRNDLNRWYACEVSGLNFNSNCVQVSAKKTAGKTVVIIEPQTDYVKVVNEVKPISSGRAVVGSYRTQQPNRIIVFGRCKDKVGPFYVAIERPAGFFGFLLAESLSRAGVRVDGQIVEKAIPDGCDVKVLAEYSNSIADCLSRCNKDSLGLAAEALLKATAADANPRRKNGTWARGQELISRYLLGLGVKRSEFHIDDASGLSRENKLSANAMTKILFELYNSENWRLYRDSLAVGGVDGTISRYFKDQKYKGRILGKTGYIRGVKSFSGICETKQGDYIFSILANEANGSTRGAINDIAKAIMDSSQSLAGARSGTHVVCGNLSQQDGYPIRPQVTFAQWE